MPQSSLPELMSQQTTITDLTAAEDAKVSMVIPADAVNETTGAIETLKVSVGQILALNRLLGNEVPTGAPISWIGASIPAGYIREGTAFDPLQYPELAQIFPSNTTPDINGRVLKGHRDPAGIGQWQAEQIKAHSHTASFSGNVMNHTHPMSHTHTRGNMEISGQFNSLCTDNFAGAGAFHGVNAELVQQGTGNRAGHAVLVNMNASRSWVGATSDASSVNTGSTSQIPSGGVTVNNTGAAENRVNAMLCYYIFRAR